MIGHTRPSRTLDDTADRRSLDMAALESKGGVVVFLQSLTS